MKVRITKVDDDYYVFRNGVKVTMTVKQMRSGAFVRSDTGVMGDKKVPSDIVKKIKKYQQIERR